MWAVAQDVRNRWLLDEPLEAVDATIETLLEEAEDTILARFPDMPASVAAGSIPLVRVVKIASALVIERLKNPRGTRQTSTTTGPFGESETFGGTNPGEMVLSDAQVRELAGISARPGRAFTVSTVPTSWQGMR